MEVHINSNVIVVFRVKSYQKRLYMRVFGCTECRVVGVDAELQSIVFLSLYGLY